TDTAAGSDATGRGAAESHARFCAVHPSQEVQVFCSNCNDLLCEVCLASGHDSSHTVQNIKEAEDAIRAKLQSLLSGTAVADGSDNRIGAESTPTGPVAVALTKVSSAIDSLHSDTLAVSQEVEEHSESICRMVKEREQQLLADLDRLRMAKLLPLEEQRRRLQQCARHQESVVSLLECCNDPYNLARMGSWLEVAVQNAIRT
ncbi:MAG: B-box zinc finger protein, partial [Pseudomonadota bacterium]